MVRFLALSRKEQDSWISTLQKEDSKQQKH